ncbi:MAG: glycoside hydrolase family 9 protein [Planctomycetaceae bacterium]
MTPPRPSRRRPRDSAARLAIEPLEPRIALAITLEAEVGVLTGTTVLTSPGGFSGSGFVGGFDADGDRVAWTFTAAAGTYRLAIRYRSEYGPKGFAGAVDGVPFSGTFVQATGFALHDAGVVSLAAGSHTLFVGGGWNYYEIDAVTLTPEIPVAPLPVPAVPVDPAATPLARALLARIASGAATAALSGQHGTADIATIQAASGELPAIVEGDLMDYSPSRVARQGMPASLAEGYRDLFGQGQFVSLAWHWNAPTGLVDTGSQPWWRGFSTEATTFDVAAAIANPAGGDYALLLRDIDAIAVQLRKFADADAPVLWRPLHEAEGGWFWWGAKGPDAFKQLWRLTYDRLVNHHGLHNLVWVLTSEDPAWYPGHDVVDVVGVDAYPANTSDTLSGRWASLLTRFDGIKPIALTEFGGVPDIDAMRQVGVRFAYFCSWSGSYGPASEPAAKVARVYQAATVTTKRENPPLVPLAGPLVVTVGSGITTVESAARAGGITLVKRGTGTLVLTVANSHTGGVVVEEGELVIRDPLALGSGGLTVRAGAGVRFDVGTAAISTAGLAIDPAARLDVGRGRLVVPAAGDAPTIIPGRVRAAALAGWATASGIGSSAVSTEQRSVGVATADGLVTVGWAAVGDTNLDGVVDMLDLAAILGGGLFDTGRPARWGEGDFNHDEVFDTLDLASLAGAGVFDAGDYRTPPAVSIADVTLTEGTAPATAAGYFRTQGSQILDADGRSVRIAGVNWFGLETSTHAPHGLWTRGYREMMDQMKAAGFNTIRLPYCDQLFAAGSIPAGIDFSKNADLQGKSGLQIIDALVTYAGTIGLRIILDHHRSDAGAGANASGLWYTSAYPESVWIANLEMLAARYAGNATVIGIDLHNEPHGPAAWGDGSANDWRLAAERAGNAVLAKNPNLLIIVEGVESGPSGTTWWGGNLSAAGAAPVRLNVPGRLVYSPHEYPASVYPQPWFSAATYPANLPAHWDAQWGSLFRTGTAPLLFGEFGTTLETASDRAWYEAFVNYLRGDLDGDGTVDLAVGQQGPSWTYWSWNPNSGDTGGILADDWTTLQMAKLAPLVPVQFTFPAVGGGGGSGTAAGFRVSLSAPAFDPVTVRWATAAGTATAGSDFTAATGTLVFAPGETAKTVAVTVVADTVAESSETFSVVLSNPENATLGRATATATIVDDDAVAPPPPPPTPPTTAFNYADVLQRSLLFYDAQRSGDLPANFRVGWRGDSAVTDGADVGIDLSGGFYDAGDHVKFGLPMTATMTMLGWGLVQYRQAYVTSGLLDEMLDTLKWGTDWIIKAHPEPNVFYAQVGNGSADHSFWGAPEVMAMARPAYRLDPTKPGSEVAAEAAAALAAASVAFRPTNAAYADTLLVHARQLYSFADTCRGRYSDSIPDAAAYYNSFSGYHDELCWAALWLHTATGEQAWLDRAVTVYDTQLAGQKLQWTQAWDDKVYGSAVLLAAKTGQARYRTEAERWLDWWTVGTADGKVRTTAGGLAFLDTWGSLRYAANTSFIALVYADTVRDHSGRYHDFAVRQIRYMLGDNPAGRSYVVGYGVNPPKNPHHRGASGVYDGNISAAFDNRHVLHGALVGGPQSASDTDYVDSRTNYVCNEVALDYNAGFQGAVARLHLEFGGGAVAPPPPAAETPGDEFFVQTAVNTAGSGFTEVRAILNNRSAWPARPSSSLSFVYFVDLSEVYAAGYTAADVQVTGGFVQGGRVGTLQAWDAVKRIYAVTVDFTGTTLAPGSGTSFWREAQFRIGVRQGVPAAAWSAANDWSYQGIGSDRANPVTSDVVPVYEAGVRLFGRVPDGVVVPPPDTGGGGTTGGGGGTPGGGGTTPVTGLAVTPTFTNTWPGGFTADVTIKNGAAAAIDGWTLEFDLDAEIVNLWNGVIVSHVGRRYVVRNASWNAGVAAGAEVTFGFQAAAVAATLPSNLVLNGRAV